MALANAFNTQGGTAATSAQRQENISGQCNGARTSFTVSSRFQSSSLKVYWNGIRQFAGVSITVTALNTFTTNFTPSEGDYLFVDYHPI